LFRIFAVEKELTLMLRQNGHNTLIITPPIRYSGDGASLYFLSFRSSSLRAALAAGRAGLLCAIFYSFIFINHLNFLAL
jgi:hypothetical protein